MITGPARNAGKKASVGIRIDVYPILKKVKVEAVHEIELSGERSRGLDARRRG